MADFEKEGGTENTDTLTRNGWARLTTEPAVMRLSFRWANPRGRMKGTKRRVNGTRRKKRGGAGEKKNREAPR